MNTPVPVLVVYSLKENTEEAFRSLLKKHWPTLKQHGLVTDKPAEIWRSTDHRRPNQVFYVETMEWKDEKASDTAHQTPEIMQIWEPMGPMLENLSIYHLEPVKL